MKIKKRGMPMKIFQREDGYSLFLTLLIVVLFAVMAVLLTTTVISGAKSSDSREKVIQAGELSEKGIEHIVNLINKELEDTIGDTGIKRDNFETVMLGILSKYLCERQLIDSSNTETGSYEVCIDNIEDFDDNELKKLVTFISTGYADGKRKETIATYEIGSGAVPEVLKYAVGTNVNSSNPRNGEGNLLLHGGVDIYGDMKVDRHLVTYDKGTGAYRWIDSIQPRIHGANERIKPRLVIGGQMYKITRNPYSRGNEVNHNNYLANNNFPQSYHRITNDPKDLFDEGYAPQIVKRDANIGEINIREQRNRYYFNQNNPSVTKVRLNNKKFSNYSAKEDKIVPYSKALLGNNYNINTTLINNNTFKHLALLGGGKIRKGNHEFTKGLYVNRSLEIGNMKQTDEPDERDNITLDGTIYVEGNVKIQGANLTSNVMMYVDGDVDIRFSSISGKKLNNNDTGTLIIFATGNIYLANNSVQQDNPTHIKGYFYSEKSMEIYGVGSNIHIDGGVSANRVVLNALRGRVSKENPYYNLNVPEIGVVEPVNVQRNKPSRLTIKYDSELIENYLKLNPPEAVIYDVVNPEILDRR